MSWSTRCRKPQGQLDWRWEVAFLFLKIFHAANGGCRRALPCSKQYREHSRDPGVQPSMRGNAGLGVKKKKAANRGSFFVAWMGRLLAGPSRHSLDDGCPVYGLVTAPAGKKPLWPAALYNCALVGVRVNAAVQNFGVIVDGRHAQDIDSPGYRVQHEQYAAESSNTAKEPIGGPRGDALRESLDCLGKSAIRFHGRIINEIFKLAT